MQGNHLYSSSNALGGIEQNKNKYFTVCLVDEDPRCSSHVHTCILSLSVWIQDQKRSRTVSPSATKDSAQTTAPPSVPASIFCSEAQTCWSHTCWVEAPASAWEYRPPWFCSLLPLSSPFHVKNPPAPQGGGWIHLWGELYLLSYVPSLTSFWCSLLCPVFLASWCMLIPKKRPQNECWLYITPWLYI